MRRFGLVVVLLVLWAVVGVPRLVGAQATPGATPGTAATCDVRAIAIGVTVSRPGATPAADAVAEPVEGPAVDAGTVADLQATLDELEACAAEGDIGKVAALFSEDGYARAVLADEPVRIELLEEGATPPAGGDGPWLITPTVAPGVIDRAVELEDGSVAAFVDPGSDAPRLVTFVRNERGRWVIDDIAPLPAGDGLGTPERPVGAEDVPAAVWDAVVASLGLAGDATITVVELEAVDWPDASLGCPEDGALSAQVITPGYRLVVAVDGERTELHTDLAGNAVGCGG